AGWCMVTLRVAVAVWLLARKRYTALAAWLLGWALADLVTFGLKPAIGRLRPDGSNFTSFPSGHAKTAAQVAAGMVLVLTSPQRSRALAWTLAAAWIVAIAASRTVLNEHYLSDVVAGTLLGAGSAVLAAAYMQRSRRVLSAAAAGAPRPGI
ncbi:MAG: phosphatase PAP2 family protein, partial [Actinomycetota bacterium]